MWKSCLINNIERNTVTNLTFKKIILLFWLYQESYKINQQSKVWCHAIDDNNKVHGNPIPFSVKTSESTGDVRKHFKYDLKYNFNSVIETAKTKSMGNMSSLKYNITGLKQNAENVMVGEIVYLRSELTRKKAIVESLLLSQSM